jgi:hypothetical protein
LFLTRCRIGIRAPTEFYAAIECGVFSDIIVGVCDFHDVVIGICASSQFVRQLPSDAGLLCDFTDVAVGLCDFCDRGQSPTYPPRSQEEAHSFLRAIPYRA